MVPRYRFHTAITVFVACLAIVPLCAHSQESKVNPMQVYDEGMVLLKAGKAAEAAAKFEAAANASATHASSAQAANELGKLYLQGNGVAWDPVKAQAWFQRSADGDDIRGMTNLGMMYSGYRGIPQDWTKAAEWLTKAAERGQPLAQCELGEIYSWGLGVERDEAKGFLWYSKAAEQGFGKAQYKVGHCHLFGLGGAAKDPKLAIEWFQKAVQSQDPQVISDIASWLLDESKEIYDPGAAAAILPVAANAGHRDAQYQLGELYYEGWGVKHDMAMAFRLINAAAGQGSGQALHHIAGMYLRGEGTEKNPQAAYVCAEMAADAGWPFAGGTRDEAMKLMTPAQLEAAKAAVEQQKAARAQWRAEQEKLNPKAPEKN